MNLDKAIHLAKSSRFTTFLALCVVLMSKIDGLLNEFHTCLCISKTVVPSLKLSTQKASTFFKLEKFL